MKKIMLLSVFLLTVSCSTNKALAEYNKQRMDKNEEYLKSVEDKTVPKRELKGTTTRSPLEEEAGK